MNEKTKAWLFAAFVFMLIGLVGRMDYTDVLESENAQLKIKNAQCRGLTLGLLGGTK